MSTVEIAEREMAIAAAEGRQGADKPPVTLHSLARRLGVAAAALAVLAGASVAGAHYWTSGRFMQSTDDAYVKADSTAVAPKISGYIAALLVTDNQRVEAGQPLARIDDRDMRAALDEARANVDGASASVANLNAQILAQGSLIEQADANAVAARIALDLSRRNDVRRQTMAKVGYGSAEQADDASADAQEKTAALARMLAAAATARQQVGILAAQCNLAKAQLERANAAEHQAELNLSYTTITAPISGTVGARTVRLGQYVQAGTQLMALVPLQQVYVVANFKETQLSDVQPGQPVRIKVDTFPGHDIRGHVDSVAPASGLEFSLLPPDNATGNFTKIVQRIPVKITFSPKEGLLGRLRPGMSVGAEVDTKVAQKDGRS